jgi:hypothetical protein
MQKDGSSLDQGPVHLQRAAGLTLVLDTPKGRPHDSHPMYA